MYSAFKDSCIRLDSGMFLNKDRDLLEYSDVGLVGFVNLGERSDISLTGLFSTSFTHSCLHPLRKHFLNTCHIPDTGLAT